MGIEELKASPGKFRIISIDKWDPPGEGHNFYKEYDSLEDALTEARKRSEKWRKEQPNAGDAMAVVYYVYDDKGHYKGGDIYKNE